MQTDKLTKPGQLSAEGLWQNDALSGPESLRRSTARPAARERAPVTRRPPASDTATSAKGVGEMEEERKSTHSKGRQKRGVNVNSVGTAISTDTGRWPWPGGSNSHKRQWPNACLKTELVRQNERAPAHAEQPKMQLECEDMGELKEERWGELWQAVSKRKPGRRATLLSDPLWPRADRPTACPGEEADLSPRTARRRQPGPRSSSAQTERIPALTSDPATEPDPKSCEDPASP